MGYLTGNFKTQNKDMQGLLLGSGLIAGSYGGGSAQEYFNGGLLLVSINANNSIFSIAAYEAMSQFYGSQIFDSGYKIVPIMVQEKIGSVAYNVFPTGSITASRIHFIPQIFTINAVATASTFTVSTSRGPSISANFTFMGLIVSMP
ncbi:MAG: hypothetical protein Q7R49_00585 [Candidatus Daviesbacteria bacterium]|nr:hypothetical protein [Candidatus Daviesbacteria bacterium]